MYDLFYFLLVLCLVYCEALSILGALVQALVKFWLILNINLAGQRLHALDLREPTRLESLLAEVSFWLLVWELIFNHDKLRDSILAHVGLLRFYNRLNPLMMFLQL